VKIIGLQKRRTTILAVALATLFAAHGRADCGVTRTSKLKSAFHLAPKVQIAMQPEVRPASGETPKDTPAPSIVGMWQVTFVSDGEVVDQGFDQWNSDGTEILNDMPPPNNVCLGIWTQTSTPAGSVIKLKHPSWTFDDAGNLTGTATIKEELTLSADGKSFMGTFTVDVVDLNGNVLQSFAGEITGDRIIVD